MADFTPPPGANDAMRKHLVHAAEIARRTGVTKQAVSLWIARHRSLAELVITWVGARNPVFWWPQVEAELARLGLPDTRYGGHEQPPCGETRAHGGVTFRCSRPDNHDGGHTDRRRRARWVGDAPATDLDGRPLLRGTIPPSKSDPRAFRSRRAAAGGDT